VTNGILIGCRVWPQYTNVGDRQTIDDRQTTTDRKSMAQACNTFGIAVTPVKLKNDLNPFQIGIYVFLVNTVFG